MLARWHTVKGIRTRLAKPGKSLSARDLIVDERFGYLNPMPTIRERARQLLPDLIDIRRDLHRHPELRFDLPRTAARVEREITPLVDSMRTGIATSGIIADILPLAHSAARERPAIALRADMDALPIQEEAAVAFRSTIDGCAHLCGHDAHTAMLIGAARILSERRAALPCPARLVFQPCEESFPGGAPGMIAGGALDNVSAIFGQHVWPFLPLGQAGLREGAFFASTDDFELTLTADGGHGAMPHRTADPILAGAHLVTALQAIPARIVDPLSPVVLSVTAFNGGFATNVIPSKVTLKGTIRTLDAEARRVAKQSFLRVVTDILKTFGVDYQLDFRDAYPVTVNHPETTRQILETAAAIVGSENTHAHLPQTMGGEDFAYYSEKIPAGFYLLGTNNGNGQTGFACHHPKFQLDESAMALGTGILASLALKGAPNHAG